MVFPYRGKPFPFAPEASFFLRVVVYEKGFAFYIDGEPLAQFNHRVTIPKGQKMFVQLSARGDYGEICSLVCDGLWAGRTQHTHIDALDADKRT